MPNEVMVVDGRVSPYATVNKKEVDEGINARTGKSDEELKTEQGEIFNRLKKGFEESGGGKDYSKTEEFGKGTDVEKMHRVMQAHADLGAVGHILAHRDALKQTAESIVLENGGGGDRAAGVPYGTPLPAYGFPQHQVLSFADRYLAQAKKAGIKFDRKPGPQNHGRVEIDLRAGGWPEIFGAVFKTDAGFPPFVTREADIVPSIIRQRRAWDVFTKYMTGQHRLEYMEQTTRTNAAAGRVEAAAAAESEIAYTKKTVDIEMVATILPVTDEQLADSDEVAALLNNDLAEMVLETAESYAVSGTGAAPQWRGIVTALTAAETFELEAANNVYTQLMKDIMLAMAGVEVDGQTMATDIMLHPQAWAGIAISEPSMGGGLYLGNPGTGFAPMIWGLPVAKSTTFTHTEGEIVGVLGNFRRWAAIAIRQDLLIESGMNGTDFAKYGMSLRASIRGALKVTRPKAFKKLLWTNS